jgi:dihydroorotase
MNRMVIKGAWVVDPSQGMDQVMDIALEDGRISRLGEDLTDDGARVIDGRGLHAFPGLIDMHVHLREPGYEYKETIATGTAAAAKGGFTAVCCMPNTLPVNDNASVTTRILDIARREGSVRVYPIGAITKGQQGSELSEAAELKNAGCVALSDDGRPVESSGKMMLAMEYAAAFGLKLISHCEDMSLARGGCMNEGAVSTLLGLQGIPAAAEEIMVAREILLAAQLDLPVHIAHVSTARGLAMIRWAKGQGIQVTCESCPHYFAATDALVDGYSTATKVNPPLRTQADREAVAQAIADGTVDAIVTDHAPHHQDDKLVEYAVAANGISGIETSLALTYTHLVKPGIISLSRMVEAMSVAPAAILGLPGGTLKPGSPADITLADLNASYAISAKEFRSKGKNTPFDGWPVTGRAVMTLVEGKVVYDQRL